jgi:CheY-like chemotaxis protein
MKRILIVEDEPHLQQLLSLEFELSGDWQPICASGAHEACTLLNNHTVDLILTDLTMPCGTGLDLLDWIRKNLDDQPPVILMTGRTDALPLASCYPGQVDILPKPFDWETLEQKVQQAKRRLLRQNAIRPMLEHSVSASPA